MDTADTTPGTTKVHVTLPAGTLRCQYRTRYRVTASGQYDPMPPSIDITTETLVVHMPIDVAEQVRDQITEVLDKLGYRPPTLNAVADRVSAQTDTARTPRASAAGPAELPSWVEVGAPAILKRTPGTPLDVTITSISKTNQVTVNTGDRFRKLAANDNQTFEKFDRQSRQFTHLRKP